MLAADAISTFHQSPRQAVTAASRQQEDPQQGTKTHAGAETSRQSADEAKSPSGQQLSDQEKKQLDELKARDREVRAHEAAHQAAAGGYARGGPSFSYQRGPDGKQYAIGGEVQIDTSAVPGDPEATLRKAQIIRRAALAPAEPSPQDRSIAAEAAAMAAQARADVAKQSGENAGLDRRLRDSGAVPQDQPVLNLIA
ncbi:MAG: hypothetical protein KDH88_11335 [Chromatiales bacterium]|nr:hypothetical protein [Chromatiales bacterium]